MQGTGLHNSFRFLGYFVVIAVLGAVAYAVAISIVHWSGIGV